MDEDILAENAQSINKIYHEVLMLMKLLQTKPQVKNMNIKYYDLYYTVIKNRGEKEIVDNNYEDDYIVLVISLYLIIILGSKMIMQYQGREN